MLRRSYLKIETKVTRMKFSKYWEYGDFVLHSGDTSHKLWNVRNLLKEENRDDLREVVEYLRGSISENFLVVGIRTMGAVIGEMVGNHLAFNPKTKRLDGNIPNDKEYVILDDVITRGTSVKEVMNCIGKLPRFIFTLVIRDDINGGLRHIRGVGIIEVRKKIGED